MSESSRSRVTITLGRTGQVVKRDRSALDSSLTDMHPVAGSKRSVHERLGNNVDSSAQFTNKRLRGDGRMANAVSDVQLSKHDLRYKIMKKNILKKSQNSKQNGMDLRNILSRPAHAQSSTNSISSHGRMFESKDSRRQHLEPMDGRQSVTETRDGRHIIPVSRSMSQHVPEYRVEHAPNPRKESILEGTGGGRSPLDTKDVRHRMPESSYPGIMPNIPGMRAPNSMDRMETGVNSYSPWTLDRLRQKSPDDTFTPIKGVAALRSEELPRRYAVRPYDDTRTSTYMTKDALDISRPMSSSHLAKVAPPLGQMKTMAPMGSTLPPSGNLMQKSSFVVDDQVTVDSFLRSLGLEKYAILFKAEEVDMYSLKRMTERDLKELGIPMGPRKKILLTLQPRLKPQA